MEENECEKWYVIAWRLFWFPLRYFGLIITYVSILFSHGKEMADTWIGWLNDI